MTCAQVSELLAAFADGGLEGREHDEVATHVRGCAACAEEVRVIRELLDDARQSGDDEAARSDRFWQTLERDIRVAVDATRPKVPWWRLPALTTAFALAAVAVIWVETRPRPAPRDQTIAGTAAPADPLGALYRDEAPDADEWASDIETARAVLARVDLEADRQAGPPTDDELAVASPAAAENLIENLDAEELARLHAAL